MTGLPDAFVSLMRQQLGDEADALLRALEEERVAGFRVAKIDASEILFRVMSMRIFKHKLRINYY